MPSVSGVKRFFSATAVRLKCPTLCLEHTASVVILKLVDISASGAFYAKKRRAATFI